MNRNRQITHRLRILATAMTLTTGSVLAAPGTLPKSPLFLSAAVEPNVYFIFDDSGSMEWENLVAGGSQGLPFLSGWSGNYYMFPTVNNGLDQIYINSGSSCTSGSRQGCFPYTTPAETSVSGAWRTRNHNYNALYYNPEITYRPWPGKDTSNNNLYADASPTAAPVDPNGTATMDLTQNFTFLNYTANLGWYQETIFPARYYTWTDTNGNGVVDTTDGRTLVEIRPGSTYTGSANRTDCAAAPTCTYAEEIQNFANWFTYYRKRQYVGKNAVGSAVNNTDDKRMGLDIFNGGNQINAASMSNTTNKSNFLQTLYGLNLPCDWNTCPGTPARTALQRVGDLYEGSSSPILGPTAGGACQQNFSILVTDGHWNGGSPGVGNTDGDGNTAYDGAPYADSFSNTLADVAMHYYERDLKPSTHDNLVRTTTEDPNPAQHMVTFGIAFGLSGTLDPNTDDPTSASFPGWPDPTDNQDDERIDDLWHAAYNGRGTFLSAQTPDDLVTGLNNALGEIAGRKGSAAAVAFNTTSLNTNSELYLALFNSGDWDGDLLAFPLNAVTGAVSSTSSWSAANKLDAMTSRTILTYNPSVADGVAFQWNDLDSSQQNDLRTNSSGTLDSVAAGLARLGFIRGDRGCEASNTSDPCNYVDAGTGTSFTSKSFRDRASRLGDIVHSAPVYVGAPELSYPAAAPFPTTSGQTYADFRNNYANRSGTVYVGANDGMLHGFRASDGQEILAYIPSMVYSTGAAEGLHYLTEPGYNHLFYVDLSPTVSDAYIQTTPTGGTGWKTILVGGLRGGGRGLFALDVTNPGGFSETGSAPADTVMWEFTHPDLGYTYSEPKIALQKTGNNSGEWVVIVGNGYNSTGGTGSVCDGEAALFVLNIEDGLDGIWSSGDYDVICTGVGSPSDRNGLATPAIVDSDNDGTVDRVYAGDLKGNLWVFDLSNGNRKVAYKQGNTPKPLFTAASGQPITVEPEVVGNTDVTTSASNAPNLIVLFGTGQYLVSADTTSTTTQSFYGVWDHGTHSLTRGDLVAQTITNSTTNANARELTANTVDYLKTSPDEGWYVDLPDSGERSITNPLARGSVVLFNTTIPDADPCLGGGSGWFMALDFLSGGRPADPVFDLNNDGVVDALDKLNGNAPGGMRLDPKIGMPTETACMGNNCYTSGTNVTTGDEVDKTVMKDLGGIGTGRFSWEELRCATTDANCTN